jgi:hypothetical protein
MKFYIAVGIAFLAAFAGISVAMRGFPTIGSGGMVALPASAAVRQTLDAQARQSAYDPDLNRLRHTTMQATYAFMVSPCDDKNKARLIEAATDYAKAFIARTNCSLLSCSRDKLEAAGAAFDTREDRKVQGALSEAFARGGIGAADFPVGRQMAMLGIIGPDSNNNHCAGGVQTRVSDKRR